MMNTQDSHSRDFEVHALAGDNPHFLMFALEIQIFSLT
jgi:hypothetical protein